MLDTVCTFACILSKNLNLDFFVSMLGWKSSLTK